MSFPIASIAVVNSVLFGVYSNALLALTATSHQERRAQPPSYTHVFIAGCTGGFLQVRGRAGAHEGTHTHTRAHTDARTGTGMGVHCFPSLPPLATQSCRAQVPKGNTRSCGETGCSWLLPVTWPS